MLVHTIFYNTRIFKKAALSGHIALILSMKQTNRLSCLGKKIYNCKQKPYKKLLIIIFTYFEGFGIIAWHRTVVRNNN